MYDYLNKYSTANHQQIIINLSGSPEQTLCQLMPTINCTCGLKKQIQIVVSACLFKIQKLREERNNYKAAYKQEKVKIQKLRADIDDWEKNYCHMRKEAIKKTEPEVVDQNALMIKNFVLQNTVKELNIKLLRQRKRNKIITQTQNLDSYFNDLKYSNTRVLKQDDSFLLEPDRKVLSPSKISNFNLTTKLSFK